MRRKKLTVISAIVGVVLAGLIAAWWLLWGQTAVETDGFRATWEVTGKPGVVEGVVLDDQHRPVAGIAINVDNDSGGQPATTDADGQFSVRPGESDITGLGVGGFDDADLRVWPLYGIVTRASCSKGIRFHIVLKPRGLTTTDRSR